ncbi:hypothetical protein BHE74_00034468 [Ensete ventricosum]|nr:hypothetical protein GW17_00020771 [Ensete ventricosum]RWW58639.1 hypothetical protein BHE74_00034468 [Ensete ventricosum]RZR89845.1 hypothetical protein BHM03_00017635 [Ensete ventricosum]
MRVELIGDRLTMVNPSFWKAMWYKTSVELLVSTMTLFTYALAMRTEITSALSWSGYSASLASKVTYGRVQVRWERPQVGWFWLIGPPSRDLRRLPPGLLCVGSLMILMFPCHQCLGGCVLVGMLEHFWYGH